MDIYVILAEFTHLLALTILLYKFYVTKSAKGVSGKTHILYVLVYLTRCNDLYAAFIAGATGPMKVIFISLTFSILYLIYFQFKDTNEKDNDICRISVLVIPSAVLAVLFTNSNNSGVIFVMSFFLEAVALVPQMVLVYNQGRFERYILPYFILLGCYRGIYALEWIAIGMTYYHDFIFPNPYCNILQTLLCVSFLYFYYFHIKGKIGTRNNYASNLPQLITNETLLEKKPSSDLPGVFVIGSKQKCEQFENEMATNA